MTAHGREDWPAWPPEAERVVDALGLRCPLPVIRLEAALRGVPRGGVVAVRADDPVAVLDLPHVAAEGGHGCERLDAPAGACAYRVTRGGAD